MLSGHKELLRADLKNQCLLYVAGAAYLKKCKYSSHIDFLECGARTPYVIYALIFDRDFHTLRE